MPVGVDDAEAYVGSEHPGNFTGVFDAYFLNRDIELSDRFDVQMNQRFLSETPLGQVITGVLDKTCEDKRTADLFFKLNGSSEQEAVYYAAQLLDISAEYLPPELDAAVLRDPWAFQEAA